jgi:isoquinoline 1-oxidoreductase beta subunit
MSVISNVSRRGFITGLVGAGAFVLSARFLPEAAWAQDVDLTSALGKSVLHPDIFLGIETTGVVHIIAHRSEMGTTTRTSLPMVAADYLDADWNRVKIEQAIGDEKYGDQSTDGSYSIRAFYKAMQQTGATARTMLMQAAAEQWKVPVSECSTDLHTVVHKASGRKLGYGELAMAASKLPVPKVIEIKKKSEWRYIGKGTKSFDIKGIVNGSATYGMDATMPGMVYASIEHCPVIGGKVTSYDEKAPLQVPGVRQTLTIDPFKPPAVFKPLGGIAVIADNTWAAFQGRTKLNAVWDNGPNASFNSDDYKKELQQTARQAGSVVRNEGDAESVFAKGGDVVEADYYVPLLAHAPMEPMVAVAEFKDGKVETWCPTQNPQAVQETIAGELGIPKENVICHVTLLGGAFGRKSKPDYVAEAAVLSKKLGKPVKVVWTREDDIQFGYYNAVAAMYMKATLDAQGKPSAWLQRSVFPPIASTFNPTAVHGEAGDFQQGWSDIPYAIPNLRVENGDAKAHVRIGWLRSVANIFHGFAVQSFSDELAHRAKRDPVEYLLELLGPARKLDLKSYGYPNYDASPDDYPLDVARLRNVVEMVADKSGWGKRKLGKGSGMGIAVHRSFLTYVATVVEVTVNNSGEVSIPRVDTVVDAGLVVNPEATRSQFEGAAVFGTSIVRSGEITAKNGAIEQMNFDSYAVARMNDAPRQTNVYIVDSDAPPAGVGEPGVPPFAPAMCNAIFAATGTRVRELPLSRTKLGKA